MQGLIIEKGLCIWGYGRKGKEGGTTGAGLGYTVKEPCKEIGPLAGIGLGGLGKVCLGLSLRGVFITWP